MFLLTCPDVLDRVVFPHTIVSADGDHGDIVLLPTAQSGEVTACVCGVAHEHLAICAVL